MTNLPEKEMRRERKKMKARGPELQSSDEFQTYKSKGTKRNKKG